MDLAVLEADNKEVVETEAEYELLPQPQGYHLLVRMFQLPEKHGSVFLPEKQKAEYDLASILAKVISIGPDAYGDEKRFPSGRYCQVGDWVMFHPYSGVRFKLGKNGREYRLINDDTVEAVISDPRNVERII